MTEDKTISIEELAQDAHNFNRGNEQGQQLMTRSFQELGAGRSILVDKNGNIIAGNKSQQAAIAAGIKRVRVIETDGTELVAVKRTDLDINSKKGREMALADNATQAANINWDEAELHSAAEQYDIDMNEWKMELPEVETQEFEPETKAEDVKELKLVFTPEQYSFVLQELRKYGDDFTHSLLQILNINV